jgi:hypothetical protein
MVWLWDNAVTIGTIVMAAAAIAALIYAHRQISESRRAERRGNANELWREYLRLAFDNPKLSDPTLKLADFNYADLIVDGSKETFQKYELFVDTSSMPARRFWKSCPQRNGTQRSASNSACIGSI